MNVVHTLVIAGFMRFKQNPLCFFYFLFQFGIALGQFACKQLLAKINYIIFSLRIQGFLLLLLSYFPAALVAHNINKKTLECATTTRRFRCYTR